MKFEFDMDAFENNVVRVWLFGIVLAAFLWHFISWFLLRVGVAVLNQFDPTIPFVFVGFFSGWLLFVSFLFLVVCFLWFTDCEDYLRFQFRKWCNLCGDKHYDNDWNADIIKFGVCPDGFDAYLCKKCFKKSVRLFKDAGVKV